MSGCAEMIATRAANPSNVIHPQDENVITSCQQTVRQMMNCCQDVVKKLETFQGHLASDRIQERLMPLEENCNNTDILLLEEKLHLSAVRIKELELVERTMKKKVEDMEEKVQTLTAQLLVYKEDFDLERRDREAAHGRIVELEQQLMFQKSRNGSPFVHCSHQRLQRHSSYQPLELVSEGHDVCDEFQSDGVAGVDQADGIPNVDRRQKIEIPTEALERTEFINCHQAPNPDETSMQLVARSFDFCDFYPAVTTAQPVVVPCRSQPGANPMPVERGKLLADGFEEPAIRATFAYDSSERDCAKIGKDLYCHSNVGVLKPDFVPVEPCPPGTWSFLSGNPTDFHSVSCHGRYLEETDSSASAIQDATNASKLICPKCCISFSVYDHFSFLDHLEEC